MPFRFIGCLFLAVTSLMAIAQPTVVYTSSFNATPADTLGWRSTKLTTNDWAWYNNVGDGGGGGFRVRTVDPTINALTSPALSLLAGVTYTVVFSARLDAAAVPRRLSVGISQQRTRTAGLVPFFDRDLPNNTSAPSPWATYSPTFTVPATGQYYLAFWTNQPTNTFTYLDNVQVERTRPPVVSINAPTTSSTFAEGTDIPVSLTAADPDGSVASLTLLMNGQALTTYDATTATQPFSYTIKDLLPASYTLTARATDNRGNVGEAPPIPVQVRFADGYAGPYAHWNFDKGLDYWKLVGDWRPEGKNGWHGTPSLWGFTLQAGNFAASPGVTLRAGQPYTVEFVDDCGASNVPVRVLFAPQQSLQDTTFIFGYKASNTDFNVRRAGTFTAPRDGLYHILIRHDWRSGAYQKLFFDNVRVRGLGLNNAPLCKITFPTQASLTVPVGSTMSLQGSASDPDGSIVKMEYFANNQKVGESTAANYAFEWLGYGAGTYDVVARATDNAGASVGYVPLRVVVVPNNFTASSYLGGVSDAEDVRGSVIQKNGAVVLAANLGPDVTFPNVIPKLLNEATANSPGCLLRLTADGKTVLALTRLAARVTDLARDSTDNLYLAAGADGLLKLNVSADTILWQKTMVTGRYVWRVDAGPGGTNIYLSSTSADPDGQLSGTEIRVQNRNGLELSNFGAVSQYSGDVVVDEATQTAIAVGFKNFNAQTTAGRLPVYVPVIRGKSFDGLTTKYVAYDWQPDSLLADGTRNPRYINASNNNMADVRAFRASLGLDGKLYVAYEVAGGNHVLRYDPFKIMDTVRIVGGDNYSSFSNSNTEIKLFVGRYDPATGNYRLGQQFTARLPNTKANTVFSKYGAIAADEDGRAYVTGASAYGIPITVDHQPGDYLGGGYLLILSPDMATREAVVRLATDARGHTLAIKNRDYFVWGGMTKSVLFRVSPVQAAAGSLQDGWFATLSRTVLSRCTDARLRESLRNGPWQQPATWGCGLLPTPLDRATISPVHTVTLTGQAAANQVIEWGKLIIAPGARLRVGQ